MAYDPTAAHGTVLKIGDGASTEAFTAIEGIMSGPDFNPSTNILTATTHSDSSIRKKASFLDEGQCNFTILWDSSNAQHELLETNRIAKTVTNFQVLFTDGGSDSYQVSAIIQSIQNTNNPDGWNEKAVTLELIERSEIS